MRYRIRSRIRLSGTSLRVRVALGVALPILLVLTALSLMRYKRERQLLQDQTNLTVAQLGEVIMGGLRHTMLTNDREMLSQTLADIGRMETVQEVQVINLAGRVIADSYGEQIGTTWRLDDRGCVECHQFPAETRSRTARSSTSSGVLRISRPIPNEPDCVGCHEQDGSHLGVLLADLSVVDIEKRLRHNLQMDLGISAGSTVLVTLGMYLLIHWLVVRRVEVFRRPLAEFAAGDFAARLPIPSGPTDELGDLANAFNHMADELVRHTQEQEERDRLRQRAIAEERHRIARELHDGLAQLLGYVNTKAMAVRMMLQEQQVQAADENLLQLEKAARNLLVDVRGAILDLKMAEQDRVNLAAALKDFGAEFSRLNGLPVELALAPAVEGLSLAADAEHKLLRIVQESLTNVRKHASATHACVSARIDDGVLELTVSDDGKGFDPNRVWIDQRSHFGLNMMRERAEAIGAEFDLDTELGAGTRVMVRLPLSDL